MSTLRMADGQPLFLHDWPCAGASGAVLFVHGLGEHGARYADLARWFNARGYAARAYDQRGHGRSAGPRGRLARPGDLLADLAAVHADYARGLPAPPLLLGHSMGGLVALRAVLDGRVGVSGLVLSSPALRSRSPAWQRALAGWLARSWPNLPLPTGLPVSGISHDPGAIAAYRADPLRHGRITPRLAHFIFSAGEACLADAARLAVPTLLLVAGADRLIDPRGSLDFAAAAGERVPLHTELFPLLYHELFNEAQPARGHVLACLEQWLQRPPR